MKINFSILGLMARRITHGTSERRVEFPAFPRSTVDRRSRLREWEQHVAYQCPSVRGLPSPLARPRGTETERLLAPEPGVVAAATRVVRPSKRRWGRLLDR
jgi:hypothetical protein